MTDYLAPLTRLERFITDHVPTRYHWALGVKIEQTKFWWSRLTSIQYIRGYLAGRFGR